MNNEMITLLYEMLLLVKSWHLNNIRSYIFQ